MNKDIEMKANHFWTHMLKRNNVFSVIIGHSQDQMIDYQTKPNVIKTTELGYCLKNEEDSA